ncbi:MAG: hypothetical protein Q8P62_05230 [Candidatus Peregrinibacteria bacterium]|nr:hypothetical protein [Candidatus Peregrinibacteria bacterium]
MENNLAENQTENQGKNENKDPKDLFEGKNQSKLTPSEIAAVQGRTLSIRDIVNERDRTAHQAKKELGKLASSSKDRKQVISLKEYREYSEKIQETESAEKMKIILDEIKEIPGRKEKEMEEDKAESETLEKDDPRLEELKEEFDETCDENIQYIGTKQVNGFKNWFKNEIDKKPQIKHLKDVIKRLKGEKSTDSGGLAPRREEYGNLQRLFKKHGLDKPEDSKYIEEEGLSERKAYRKNAEAIEDQLMKGKEKGFYSKEVIRDTMQQALTADSPEKQRELKSQLDKVSRLESESFTHLDSKTTVGGITIRKMSQKGKDFLLDYYKTVSLDEREENVRMWPKFIEDEAALAEDLLEIYEDNPEGFKLAMGSFQHLTFDEKEEALKEHKLLVETATNKEELETKLTIKAAHGALDEAARNNIIAKGKEKTQGKYKEFFEDEENFKNPKTGKEGDLGELKKAYELLINKSPNKKYKNLAAYEESRKEYEKGLKRLGEFDDDLDEKDLAEMQEEYDKEGWTDREDLQEELEKQIEKAKEKHDKMKRVTKVADTKELTKGKKLKKKESGKENEDNEDGPKTPETAIKAANKLLMNDEGAEALKVLLEYNDRDPDHPKILFWLEKTAEYIRSFGSGKQKIDESFEAELEDEIEEAMGEEETKKFIEEEQLETLSLEGTEESERLHGNKKSAKERAEDESLSRVGTTSLEAELTQDFYENSDEEFILDKEGKGEEVTEVQFDDTEYKKEEVQDLKKEVYHKQDRLREKRGLVDTVLKDKDGKAITTKEAQRLQQKDVDNLEEEIMENMEENIATKKGTPEGAEVFDLTQRIAAKRKAKEMLNKRLHTKLTSEN